MFGKPTGMFSDKDWLRDCSMLNQTGLKRIYILKQIN